MLDFHLPFLYPFSMCGRFAIIDRIEKISEYFSIDEIVGDYRISYNMAPGEMVPAVIQTGTGRSLLRLKWGLIPSWSKDPSVGNRMINARGETVLEKPSFRSPIKSKRCLIVASGFYEWEKKGMEKSPVYIYKKDSFPLGMAGIYDRWVSPAGDEVLSCTIITTESNELLRPIHDRMPVIIPKNMHNQWLSAGSDVESKIVPLLKPFPGDQMVFHHVSKIVNSAKNKSPECIEPLK